MINVQIKLLINGDMGSCSNCYGVLSDKAAIVIDPGACTNEVLGFLLQNIDKKCLILLTHAHFDHISGADELRRKTGVKIAIGEHEEFALRDKSYNLSGIISPPIAPFSADYTISDEEEFTVGDITVQAIETPGHTVGGMCYLIEDCIFSGDILFRGSAGRTDFKGGSIADMKQSLDRLMWTLDDEIKVYSGHGAATTIGHERSYNPYLR